MKILRDSQGDPRHLQLFAFTGTDCCKIRLVTLLGYCHTAIVPELCSKPGSPALCGLCSHPYSLGAPGSPSDAKPRPPSLFGVCGLMCSCSVYTLGSGGSHV